LTKGIHKFEDYVEIGLNVLWWDWGTTRVFQEVYRHKFPDMIYILNLLTVTSVLTEGYNKIDFPFRQKTLKHKIGSLLIPDSLSNPMATIKVIGLHLHKNTLGKKQKNLFGHQVGYGLFQTVNGEFVHGEDVAYGHDGLGITPHVFGYGV